jgi:CMP/dCMP kinase
MLIAIDGPAASGKGTVAKKLAEHYGLEYLDTGRLYRLVGWELLKNNPAVIASDHSERGNPAETSDGWIASSAMPPRNDGLRERAIGISHSLDLSSIGSEEIETEEVGRAASIVSAIPEVRAALLEFQRNIAKSPKGAVLDGRDIGTVICPNADFKFYITAEPEARAKRRYLQLKARKKNVSEAEILKDILSRDERDKNREVAPLVPAMGAIYIDTTEMDVEHVFAKIRDVIEERGSC